MKTGVVSREGTASVFIIWISWDMPADIHRGGNTLTFPCKIRREEAARYILRSKEESEPRAASSSTPSTLLPSDIASNLQADLCRMLSAPCVSGDGVLLLKFWVPGRSKNRASWYLSDGFLHTVASFHWHGRWDELLAPEVDTLPSLMLLVSSQQKKLHSCTES